MERPGRCSVALLFLDGLAIEPLSDQTRTLPAEAVGVAGAGLGRRPAAPNLGRIGALRVERILTHCHRPLRLKGVVGIERRGRGAAFGAGEIGSTVALASFEKYNCPMFLTGRRAERDEYGADVTVVSRTMLAWRGSVTHRPRQSRLWFRSPRQLYC